MAKYRAEKDGYLGKVPFAEGDNFGRVKKGEIFTYSGPKGKWMLDLDANGKPKPAAVNADPDTLKGLQAINAPPKELEPEEERAIRKGIMAKLEERCISFFKGAPTKTLQALLSNSEG